MSIAPTCCSRPGDRFTRLECMASGLDDKQPLEISNAVIASFLALIVYKTTSMR